MHKRNKNETKRKKKIKMTPCMLFSSVLKHTYKRNTYFFTFKNGQQGHHVLNGFSLSCFPPLKLSEDMTKRKKARVYTEVFKLKVLRDFYSSGESAWSIARKWEIDPNSLYQWKRRWPIGSKELSLPAETLAKIPMPKPTPEKTAEELLQDRITALEHALALEKMRSRAFEKMIEIAESEEGISILKKDGAKQ